MEPAKPTIRLQSGPQNYLKIVRSCDDDIHIGMICLWGSHGHTLWDKWGTHLWLRQPHSNGHLIGEINQQGDNPLNHPEYRELPEDKQPCVGNPDYQGGIRFDSVKTAVEYLMQYYIVALCPSLAWNDLGLEPPETSAVNRLSEEQKSLQQTPDPAAEQAATGRRKTAVARVRIIPGNGKITINGRTFEDYFPLESYQKTITHPLTLTDTAKQLDIRVNVRGGGQSGQAEAARHGISRALLKIDAELRPRLKSEGLLTRDPRMKERKKYGQPGARRRFQYSKR